MFISKKKLAALERRVQKLEECLQIELALMEKNKKRPYVNFKADLDGRCVVKRDP